jgi:4-hydroxybutyrate dehydrogenase/sulfolactaldehyde 3-reductase
MKAGFIGLGNMGRPMASNLARKGFELKVYDIQAAAVAELKGLGASPAASVAEATKDADVIITMLPNSQIVQQVVSGAEGVIASAEPGAIILDMSTIDPDMTDLLAKLAKAAGLGFVDAPVGRLATHAAKGESLFMVGGSDEDVSRVRPLLDAMGTTVFHCGPAGAGTRTKLVNNFLAIGVCQLNAEALALGKGLGLELERTLEVINGTSAYNGQLQMAWPNKVLLDDTAPGFALDLAHKDLSLVMNAAVLAKIPMPMAAAAREAFSAARAKGFGGNDFSAILDAQCAAAGLDKVRFKTRT